MWGDFLDARKGYDEYRKKIVAAKKAGKPEQGWDILWSDRWVEPHFPSCRGCRKK